MSKKKLALPNRRCKVSRMNGEGDKGQLETLRAYYENEIRKKESDLATLKAKLANVGELARDAATLSNPASEPNKYSNSGLTEAALDALGFLWRSGRGSQLGITAAQVRDYMLAHGYAPAESSPHNFEINVSITLRRLADSGRIERAERLGRKFYRPKRRTGRSLRFSGTGGGLTSR